MKPQSIQKELLAWYDRHRRDLPWRRTPANPYHVLVSEVMLQQTRVATVVPYYHAFLEKFPEVGDLAEAREQEVLRLWQGLGYYSRARNLQAAAKRIVAEHDGKVPSDAPTLRTLPGVGRYTAGAVASIAFGKREAVLDGNVARVLCRLEEIESDPRQRDTAEQLWKIAERLVPKSRPGDFNSALMELGATVCTPKNPQCDDCPLQKGCRVRACGTQHRIPVRPIVRKTPLVQRWTYAIRHGDRWLIEQRPNSGRWAGLWQFITVKAGETPDMEIAEPRRLGRIEHELSHRRYRFTVWACTAGNREKQPNRRWVKLSELEDYPMSKPQLTIRRMLGASISPSPQPSPGVPGEGVIQSV